MADERNTALLRQAYSRLAAIPIPDDPGTGDVYTDRLNVLLYLNRFLSGLTVGFETNPHDSAIGIFIGQDADKQGILVQGGVRAYNSDTGGEGLTVGGFAFIADPDTGMFSPSGHNELNLAVAGNKKIELTTVLVQVNTDLKVLGNLEVVGDLISPFIRSPNTQTASYTFVSGDKTKCVEIDNAGATTLTVPPNSGVGFSNGTQLMFRQKGAGAITLTPGVGVTLRSRGGLLNTNGQWAEGTVTKRATNEWVVAGDLA